MKQLSAEWFDAKRGKSSASHMADVMAKKTSAGRINYMVRLICERLTGETAESFVSREMEWGIENEQHANTAYELATGHLVELVGFVDHPSIPMTGASPDGLIGDDGCVEFKCPATATHVKTLLGESIKKGYLYQMMWQMEVMDRSFCDFVSYDPRLPENLQLHIERVDRDEALIEEIRMEVISFNGDLEKLEAKLRAKLEPAGSGDKNDTGKGNAMVVDSETGVTLKQESFLPEETPPKASEVF